MSLIREWRENAALKQEDIGKALGVTQSAVSQWESGETHPRGKQLLKFAAMLNRTSDEILAAISAAKQQSAI